MKLYTERKEIAQVLNFNKYPVIIMDIEHSKSKLGGVYEGTKVRLDWQREVHGTPMHTDCKPTIFIEGDEDTPYGRVLAGIDLQSSGACIHSDFTGHDVIEMAENANNPRVIAGQEVIVVYKSNKLVIVRKMKVSDRIDVHCSTVATLVDVDE